MIPPKAIKKVKNEIHLEIAAGSLIAYGVFPQTAEGIQKAKETAASKDTWLAPSDLPEYYDGIDNDLITGKETDGIRAIRRHLKDFYDISSAGTEVAVDTRVSAPAPAEKKNNRPATPSGIQIQWFSLNQVGPSVWEKLKAQLTGKGYFSEVNLSEKDADELIANIKKSGEFPSLKDQSGIHNEVYQNWLVDTYLPNYANTQIYNPGDKFVDDGKEFADKIVDDLDVALEEKSNEIEDAIDAILEADKKKYEDFKKQLNRKVDHPELYEELQHIQPRYMWGQNGLYDLEFKSDIDRALYFAGKLGKKDTPDKVAVRAWLKDVTGLDVRDDYREVKEYRDKILALILQLVKLHPQEREIIIPPVYDGYYQDPDEEEEEEDDEEEMDDEEYDDLYGSNLDDLLDSIKDGDGEDPEEVEDQIEEKKEELEDAVEEQSVEEDDDDEDMGSEDDIPDELLQDEVDPSVLEEIINKRKGKTGTKEKKSYYVSNTKLLQGITKSLAAVTGQLEQVNQSLLEQNDLIRANIEISTASLEALQAQDAILETKFDAILNAFQKQYEQTEKAKEDAERLKAEQQLENKTVSAGAEDPEDLTGGKKGRGRTLFGRISKYFGKKFGSAIWRKFAPKGLRSAARLARLKAFKARSAPAKLASKIGSKVGSKVTGMLPEVVTKNVMKAPKGKLVEKILRSRKFQEALVKKVGKEGAEKLTVKLAAKLIPGVGTAYGIGEALTRTLLGDIKGGFLSLGSAIPFAGYGFAAIDILRDLDVNAYTKHIESNLPNPSDANIAAFFAEALGLVEGEHYERGTEAAQPGTAMLHGTEMLVDKDKIDQLNPFNSIGATLVAAASKFINGLGPAGAQIAPLFEQKAAPLVKLFGLPATTAQTNVGGGFSYIGGAFNKVEKKKEKKEEEGYGKEFDDLLAGNSESFAEKLLKMIDPRNIFSNILSFINRTDAPEFNGDSLVAEGGEAVASGDISSQYGWRWGKMHAGIDIASGKFKQGTPISVIKPGTVAFAGWQDPNNKKAGWGQFVAIKHDDGTASLYGHLDQINVTKGQRVEPDSTGKFPVIGKLGNTGSSTGAHLHFEVGTGWTGGTLSGHIDPAPVVGQYLRGGGNVKKKETTGDAPTVAPGAALSGQEITQNFGMQTGQERMFTSGDKQYKAHKTAKGFEFYDGMTRLNTSGGSNNQILRDFMESQGVAFERTEAASIADDFARENGITYDPVPQKQYEFINQYGTDETKTYMIINQQQMPALPQNHGVRFIQSNGKWMTDKEYDVKTLEKLRLSLQ